MLAGRSGSLHVSVQAPPDGRGVAGGKGRTAAGGERGGECRRGIAEENRARGGVGERESEGGEEGSATKSRPTDVPFPLALLLHDAREIKRGRGKGRRSSLARARARFLFLGSCGIFIDNYNARGANFEIDAVSE